MATSSGFKVINNQIAATSKFKEGLLTSLTIDPTKKNEAQVIAAGGLIELMMTQDKTTREGINAQLVLANKIINEIRQNIEELHERPVNEPVSATDLTPIDFQLKALAENLLQTEKYIGQVPNTTTDFEKLLQSRSSASTPASTPRSSTPPPSRGNAILNIANTPKK